MTTTWDPLIRAVLEGARREAGGGAALAAALRDAGVGPDSGAYSESAVSNWIKGRTRPPADVVLAAASLYGVSLDQPLGVAAAIATGDSETVSDAGEVGELRAALTRLEAVVNSRLSTSERSKDAERTKDVVAVFATRAEAQAEMPFVRTLAAAERVDMMGLSLNAVCQGVSDVTLTELIENGLRLRCLFLDPDGEAIRVREREEGVPAKHLAELTRTNIRILLRLRDQLSPQATDRIEVRAYDETLRFNITIVDGQRAVVQPYLQHSRGLDSPTLVIESSEDEPHGLFPTFEHALAEAWSNGRDVDA